MNHLLAFAVWAFYVALIVWAAAVAGRHVNRHYNQQGEKR